MSSCFTQKRQERHSKSLLNVTKPYRLWFSLTAGDLELMHRTDVAGGNGLSGLFLIPYGTGRRCEKSKALVFCQFIKGTIILSGPDMKLSSLHHVASCHRNNHTVQTVICSKSEICFFGPSTINGVVTASCFVNANLGYSFSGICEWSLQSSLSFSFSINSFEAKSSRLDEHVNTSCCSKVLVSFF